MKVLLGTKSCGLILNQYALTTLFQKHPELFDTLDHQEFLLSNEFSLSNAERRKLLAERFTDNTVVSDTEIHFLLSDPSVRSNKWLLEQFERDPIRIINPSHLNGVKVVEIPDDVKWYLSRDDDCSESVYEEHRVWR